MFFGQTIDLLRYREPEIATMGIGRKFQKPTVFEQLSVFENLELALKTDKGVAASMRFRLGGEQKDRIAEILHTIHLAGSVTRQAGLLSHGQKQWLEIGMLLAQEPKLLLLDEPVAGMTDEETERTGELFKSLSGKHSLVVVEHDMAFIAKLAKQVTVLHEGSVLAEGTLDAVQANDKRGRGLPRPMTKDTMLKVEGINQYYGGSHILRNVSLRAEVGMVTVLLGRNGVGKTTLLKSLMGLVPIKSGSLQWQGQDIARKTPYERARAGIGYVPQGREIFGRLTVEENLRMGLAYCPARTAIPAELYELFPVLKQMLHRRGGDLSGGQQQQLAIARALAPGPRLLILDEPTSALNEDDVDNLFDLMRDLRQHGVTLIMITHKLREVMRIADSVTVIRDGKSIVTLDAAKGEVTEQAMIKHMVGREIDNIYPPRAHKRSDEVVLEVKDWNVFNPAVDRTILKNNSFNLKRGEIIGFSGLMGSGRTELALSMFGNPMGYKIDGEMTVNGKHGPFHHPEDAMRAGIAYVSEDRKRNGLILIQDVRENTTLANLRALATRGVIDGNREIQVANEYKTSLNIKTPTIQQKVGNLSGGNQQKVSLAKWLFAQPNVLILDEPTRGIDVGAKFEIYTLMNRLVEQGMSIIMISSELPEVLGMSDRVYVVSAGEITGELPIAEATQERIMQLATMN